MSNNQITISDLELQYHESKTRTDALVASLLREWKSVAAKLERENIQLKAEIAKLKPKTEVKK